MNMQSKQAVPLRKTLWILDPVKSHLRINGYEPFLWYDLFRFSHILIFLQIKVEEERDLKARCAILRLSQLMPRLALLCVCILRRLNLWGTWTFPRKSRVCSMSEEIHVLGNTSVTLVFNGFGYTLLLMWLALIFPWSFATCYLLRGFLHAVS